MNILITGANEGIGYYMARELLRRGNCVAVLDVNVSELRTLAAQYGRLLPIVCDVRDTAAVDVAVRKAAGAFGGIDAAVHNACRCTFGPFAQTDFDAFHDVLDVNYFGALRLARCVLPYMERAGRGRVLFTGSGVGVTGFTDISPYASSKGAIEALAKSLSLEYAGRGITFHILHPPLTRTRSASPLPVPDQMKADPQTVGEGLARRIQRKGFVICHSAGQQFQTRLCYLFPVRIGRLMNKMAGRAQASQG